MCKDCIIATFNKVEHHCECDCNCCLTNQNSCNNVKTCNCENLLEEEDETQTKLQRPISSKNIL